MSRKQYSLGKKLVVAVALALGTFGVAIADDGSLSRFGADNSMSRLGGQGYAYFDQKVRGDTAASAAWRQGHPNGLTESDLAALSSSSVAASASQLDKPSSVLASLPADPSWRQSHPSGLTERELQAAGASSLAVWQIPNGSGVATAPGNIAQGPGKETSLARK